jgi:hypothetical protein
VLTGRRCASRAAPVKLPPDGLVHAAARPAGMASRAMAGAEGYAGSARPPKTFLSASPRSRLPPSPSVVILIGEHAANSSGLIPGLSVPLRDFCCQFVPISKGYCAVPCFRNPYFTGISCLHRWSPNLRSTCALSAWRGRMSLSKGSASFISNSRRPTGPIARKGAHNPWSHRLRPTGLQAIY